MAVARFSMRQLNSVTAAGRTALTSGPTPDIPVRDVAFLMTTGIPRLSNNRWKSVMCFSWWLIAVVGARRKSEAPIGGADIGISVFLFIQATFTIDALSSVKTKIFKINDTKPTLDAAR